MNLVFATNNPHKIAEIKAQLGDAYTFRSLKDIGCTEEVPETTGTLEGNARQKAHFIKDNYGHDCFSEDTGLEVDGLGGEPGVDTAHYAGPERDAIANSSKVLEGLKQKLAQGTSLLVPETSPLSLGEGPGKRRQKATISDSKTDRSARFRTFICLLLDGEEHLFEGRCEGTIADGFRGEGGFGYDPIFIPAEGDGRSFGEMNGEEKRQFSHRARAMAKLQDFLRSKASAE